MTGSCTNVVFGHDPARTVCIPVHKRGRRLLLHAGIKVNPRGQLPSQRHGRSSSENGLPVRRHGRTGIKVNSFCTTNCSNRYHCNVDEIRTQWLLSSVLMPRLSVSETLLLPFCLGIRMRGQGTFASSHATLTRTQSPGVRQAWVSPSPNSAARTR